MRKLLIAMSLVLLTAAAVATPSRAAESECDREADKCLGLCDAHHDGGNEACGERCQVQYEACVGDPGCPVWLCPPYAREPRVK
jgi:uncharacterized membrane protein